MFLIIKSKLMKKNNIILYTMIFFVTVVTFLSCKKFVPESIAMEPIDVGAVDTYESLEENSTLTIPVKYTSPSDSGISRAVYKVVNNRYNDYTLIQSPEVPIPFTDNTVNTTINVPVRTGLLSVVVIIYNKGGRMSSKSVNVKKVVPSTANVKTLLNVEMSSDPADNKNFFSMYEANPVFGRTDALTKQDRVDLIMVNMSNAGRLISPMAYTASTDYYNASKPALTGFSTITYMFLSSPRTYVNRANFNAINTDADLTKFYNDSVMAIPPLGGGNYNVINADRRVSNTYGATTTESGFLVGWGYRSHPTATAVVLNEAFALIIVKSVTRKTNGHYIMIFDIKGPSKDQRADYNATTIAPYQPFPL